ncbi:MAG: hypothetical protein G4V63_02615 [Candidatus Afipia apatlaquensis]|uniref:Calcineurin-like phosphoesterase domain-containing protein n=1 Tax=Candidatus Afipia apatlaquensis TaxID=2712852 RepID=A0A7C9RDJ8_9BRAD|nr:hypothetical protein [Candidatus Afipia apatlaquensis]
MRLLPALSGLMLIIATALNPASAAERIGGDTAFSFVALGDMPYNLPEDYTKFDRLIAAVNALKPAFTLHMGDIKSGGIPCSDEVLKKSYDQIQTFEGALVYTIGDNEWLDCHRKAAGGYNPRERLAKLREMFFATPGKSLGKAPLDVESQALLMPEFSTYVENTRFAKNGVMFLTAHVPGSNNGFEAQDPDAAPEFFARDKANVAWINASFAKASADNAKAVVIFVQAEFDESRFPNGAMPRQSGFTNTLDAIEAGAKSFGKPVLLIHGDEHYFSIAPLRNSKGRPIPGVNKLMVYGDTLVHAVRVVVDPDSSNVFGFIPLIVPENGMGK